MIEIKKYSPELKSLWNDFVESSKNGTFLFNRDYMDYHSDRFPDNSLLIFRKGKLYCLLPANISDGNLYSHQGLTYGGLIMNEKCTAEGILEVFDKLTEVLQSWSIKKFIYKPVPYIYSTLPSQEDLYALFRKKAILKVRNVSSTIDIQNPIRLHKDRREAVRRALRNGLSVVECNDCEQFWEVLQDNLQQTYGATPVHTLNEMNQLKARFPENIKLWGAFSNEKLMGGVLCYYTKTLIHSQYISATPEGKKCGAIDLIINFLIDTNQNYKYFDLGTSNEEGGRILNESLIYQKEGFGGRAVCYDTYQIDITDTTSL